MFESHNEQRFSFGGGRGFGRERIGRDYLNVIILEIINEEPQHGYSVIKTIENRFHGFYAPSAGSVYPILQAFEDQGFVTSSTENSKKIYTITAEGKNELEKNKERFAHMREHMREHFGGTERSQGLMGEMKQTMHFMFSKLREKGLDNPETIKKLRIALVHFKNEVEEILIDQKEGKKDE